MKISEIPIPRRARCYWLSLAEVPSRPQASSSNSNPTPTSSQEKGIKTYGKGLCESFPLVDILPRLLDPLGRRKHEEIGWANPDMDVLHWCKTSGRGGRCAEALRHPSIRPQVSSSFVPPVESSDGKDIHARNRANLLYSLRIRRRQGEAGTHRHRPNSPLTAAISWTTNSTDYLKIPTLMKKTCRLPPRMILYWFIVTGSWVGTSMLSPSTSLPEWDPHTLALLHKCQTGSSRSFHDRRFQLSRAFTKLQRTIVFITSPIIQKEKTVEASRPHVNGKFVIDSVGSWKN